MFFLNNDIKMRTNFAFQLKRMFLYVKKKLSYKESIKWQNYKVCKNLCPILNRRSIFIFCFNLRYIITCQWWNNLSWKITISLTGNVYRYVVDECLPIVVRAKFNINVAGFLQSRDKGEESLGFRLHTACYITPPPLEIKV